VAPVAVTPKTAKLVLPGVSEDRVRSWLRRGLPHMRDGKATIIRTAALLEFIARHEVVSGTPANDDASLTADAAVDEILATVGYERVGARR
jgi:hypothetical protein